MLKLVRIKAFQGLSATLHILCHVQTLWNICQNPAFRRGLKLFSKDQLLDGYHQGTHLKKCARFLPTTIVGGCFSFFVETLPLPFSHFQIFPFFYFSHLFLIVCSCVFSQDIALVTYPSFQTLISYRSNTCMYLCYFLVRSILPEQSNIQSFFTFLVSRGYMKNCLYFQSETNV